MVLVLRQYEASNKADGEFWAVWVYDTNGMGGYKMFKTNYDVIKDSVELFAADPRAFKSFIESLYAFSLKGLSKRKDRDIKIILTDIQALGQSNQSYCDWRDEFNHHNATQYDTFLADDVDFAGTIKEMRGILRGGKKKNHKRSKKITTRLYKDVKKVCITYGISPVRHYEFCLALRVGFFAYREAIINIRRRLCSELYQLIPATLSIIKSGKKYAIKDLYKESQVNNNKTSYHLDPEIDFSKEDLRNIQLELYPHIFKSIYRTIRF